MRVYQRLLIFPNTIHYFLVFHRNIGAAAGYFQTARMMNAPVLQGGAVQDAPVMLNS